MLTPERREKNRIRQERKRERDRERDRLLALAEAERQERDTARREISDEMVVSNALRRPLIGRDGTMLIGARMEVIEGRPSRVDVLAALKLSPRRKRAGHQLQADWREVGAGVNVAAVDYLRAGGAGEGMGGHAALVRQIATHDRLRAALTASGAFAGLLSRVVLAGVPLAVWAEEAGKTWALARRCIDVALDRVADSYYPESEGRAGERILTIGPARAEYDMAVGSND